MGIGKFIEAGQRRRDEDVVKALDSINAGEANPEIAWAISRAWWK